MSKFDRQLWHGSAWGTRRITNFFGKGSFQWKHMRFWNSKQFKDIETYVTEKIRTGHKVYPSTFAAYPHWSKIFRSLLETPYDKVKIVIIGQDPYYTKGMGDGLAFSVPPNTKKIPGSLLNIFHEYKDDLSFPMPRTGDLSTWAHNGILLFNAVWTVEDGAPKSHTKINGKQLWQELTAEIISHLNKKDKVVFILWGKVAQEWRYLIDEKKHLVLEGAHPSPRNFTWTGKGAKFRGGKYFSKACEYLDLDTKIWRLP